MTERRKRDWPRFNLRTMFVVVAANSVCLICLRFAVVELLGTRILVLNSSEAPATVAVECPNGIVKPYGIIHSHAARSRLFSDTGEGPLVLHVNQKRIIVDSYVTSHNDDVTLEFDSSDARVK